MHNLIIVKRIGRKWEEKMANITYKLATRVADDGIYEAFMTGFSDYIIKLQMEKEPFFDRFFGPEGNTKC